MIAVSPAIKNKIINEIQLTKDICHTLTSKLPHKKKKHKEKDIDTKSLKKKKLQILIFISLILYLFRFISKRLCHCRIF